MNNNVKIKINNKEYTVDRNKTVLQVCRENNIDIPTLCYDEQLEPYGSCFLCTVEIKGARRKFSLSCATKVADGMEVQTDTKDIWKQRKMALELLLSNHYADCRGPCYLTCPSNVDVQGYIAAIAEGKYTEAIKIIKQDNPFPAVCGRVCTRPCEDECRRNLVDSKVGIDFLKRYAADKDFIDEFPYVPETKDKTGKKIAIIGAGPSGLSAAYYLAINGHDVDIFEQYEKAGGMLRYGIPEYRLPNDVLDREIKSITDLGPKIFTNKKLGKDFTLDELKEKGYDAVYIAIGAHKSVFMGVEGEDANGVYGGIDFLRDVVAEKDIELGEDVIVIGGGNTAIDTARVSLRLGAKNVTMIYRRTIKEMPAHITEIEDAQEEGVEIEFLTNPVKIIKDENGKVKEIECVKMALGEPDSSGRRRPMPIEGSEFRIKASTVIFAIGQRSDLRCMENEEKAGIRFTRWRTIEANEKTFMTDIEGVFAGGDFRRGADTVIGGIADGKKAAWVIDKYLHSGEVIPYPEEFYSKKDTLQKQVPEFYVNFEKKPKMEMPKLSAEKRVNSFFEVELGFSDKMAETEADRCLECGCQSVFECDLKDYSTNYNTNQSYYKGEFKDLPKDDSHPYIVFEPNKCISCSRCVRMCKEVIGLSILGLVNRGFKTIVRPALEKPLLETDCISCGVCADTCPTGAITIKPDLVKPGPFKLEKKSYICPFCSYGCELEVEVFGNKIVNVKGKYDSEINAYGNICKLGRFANREINKTIAQKVNYDNMMSNLEKLKDYLLSIKNPAIFVSDNASFEEMYLLKKISDELNNCTIGSYKNTNRIVDYTSDFAGSIDDLRNSDLIILTDILPYTDVPMVMPEIMKRRKNGAKLVYIGNSNINIKRNADFYFEKDNPEEIINLLNKLEEEDFIKESKNIVIITSHRALQTGTFASIYNLIKKLKNKNAHHILFGEGVNALGAEILGLNSKIKSNEFEGGIVYQECIDNEDIVDNFYVFHYKKIKKDKFVRMNQPFASRGTFINAMGIAEMHKKVRDDLNYSNLLILVELLNMLANTTYSVDGIIKEIKEKYSFLKDIKEKRIINNILSDIEINKNIEYKNIQVNKKIINTQSIKYHLLT